MKNTSVKNELPSIANQNVFLQSHTEFIRVYFNYSNTKLTIKLGLSLCLVNFSTPEYLELGITKMLGK